MPPSAKVEEMVKGPVPANATAGSQPIPPQKRLHGAAAAWPRFLRRPVGALLVGQENFNPGPQRTGPYLNIPQERVPAAAPPQPTAAGAVRPVTAAEVGESLAAISVTATQKPIGEQPDFVGFNEIAYSNSAEKRRVFQSLVAVAAGAVEKGESVRTWLQRNWKQYSRDYAASRGAIASAEKKLAALRQKKDVDSDAIEQAEAAVSWAYQQRQELVSYVESRIAEMPLTMPMDRTYYDVSVGGTRVQLYDTVVTYATDVKAGLEGHATVGDSRAIVDQALARSGLSRDAQEILRRISNSEGTFTTVNTWDRAVVTSGFLQWTTGESGDGSLVGLLRVMKEKEPELYRSYYLRFGVDIQGNELKITGPDGATVVGSAAARKVQSDPKLTAVFAAAGTDPRLQDIQVSHGARMKIERMLAWQISFNGQILRVGDLINSVYGVGVMADSAVHGGEGTVLAAVQRGLAQLQSQQRDQLINFYLSHSRPALALTPALTRTARPGPQLPSVLSGGRGLSPGLDHSPAGPGLRVPQLDVGGLLPNLPQAFGVRIDPTDPEVQRLARPLVIRQIASIDPERAAKFVGLDDTPGSWRG